MFAARQGFFPPLTVSGGFGNSSFWSTTVNSNRWLGVNSSTDLITWKATSGFTIEYWTYTTSTWPGAINPGPGNQDTGGTNYWSFGPASSPGILEFYYWGPGGNFIRTANNTLALDTWYNICLVATSVGSTTTITFYVNGVRVQSSLNGGAMSNSNNVSNGVVATGTPFRMGRYGSQTWRGYVDNLRVSNTARYSGASYTVQTSPFTSDAQTQLLMIMDGPDGSTTFTDSSSFARTVTNNTNLVTISNARANHS